MSEALTFAGTSASEVSAPSGTVPATHGRTPVDYLPDWVDEATAVTDRSTVEFLRMAEAVFKHGEACTRGFAAMAFRPMRFAAPWAPAAGLVSLLQLQLGLMRQAQSWCAALLQPRPLPSAAPDR